jgi:hypothetical protein
MIAIAACVIIGGLFVVFLVLRGPNRAASGTAATASAPPVGAQTATPNGSPGTSVATPGPGAPELESMEVARAVMVTVELDFGSKVPTIAEALREVERRYRPDDGLGRTFAVLDAYGEPTPDGKLHMSMHVSSEKPGYAGLVFKRTGAILWQARILPTTNPPGAKTLLITVADPATSRSFTVDGSSNPPSVLDAGAKELGIKVRDAWPDGAEREVTFVYSACGCPVKAMVRRTGDRTVRTKDLPVMFPDDPAAMAVISRLMGW